MSLGVLALPQAVAVMRLIPGLLIILILSILAGYTGLASFADARGIIGGTFGSRLVAVSQCLLLIFIMVAHILSFSIALNVIIDHSQCTVIFMILGSIVCFILGLPRTLKGVSFLSIFSCISIITAVTVITVALGISNPDAGDIKIVQAHLSTTTYLNPVMNIILAFSGHVAFFGLISKMKQPRDFPKLLVAMQTLAVTFYTIIAAVICYFADSLISSPALDSASPLVRKIGFGIALPTMVIAGVIYGSVVSKFIYLRLWKGTNVVHEKTVKSVESWVAICAITWFVAWVIAEAIPKLNLLLGLIGALFGSWFSYSIPTVLWLYMNYQNWTKNRRNLSIALLNASFLVLGIGICISGLYSSGYALAHG
ncbi:hypothetical protein CC78DRAFT_552304 [Lojkania enalia]|uniref:Amino acid transporter transmembrane domain-containing protein n=1 Tax=Lojkania enalia TaxID=147567 RepID=A0A9P4KFA0_9PLEO|nr:hypothetical protein CC78DRAFT_552304 [Didymosphaeria enalia]